MDWVQAAFAGVGGALVASAMAFEGLYRLRDTETIRLELRGRQQWEALPVQDGLRCFTLTIPFINDNRRYEQTLVDVRPAIRLLKQAGAGEVEARVSVRLAGREGREDGYWAANLLGPGETCDMHLHVTLHGAVDDLTKLHAAVVSIAFETYGRVDLQHFEEEIVLPLAGPKSIPEPVFGHSTMIQCIPTPILTDADDIVAVVDQYTRSLRQPGDIVAIAESVVAITQRRYFRPREVKPGFWARRLCFFVPSKGSLSSQHGFQLAMNEVGALRMVGAFFLGALGKLLGRNGIMYEVAGRPAELIDDITGTMPPFDKYIVAGPAAPEQVVKRIKERTGLEAAIVDANDLKRVMVLAVTPDTQAQEVSRLLLDNPFGNAAEQTPIVLLRPQPPRTQLPVEGNHVQTPAL